MARKIGLREKLPAELLYQRYVIDKKTINELAHEYQCTKHAIHRLLKVYDISRRTSVESRKTPAQDLLPKELLFELYVNQGLGNVEIEKMFNKKPGFVSTLLKRYGIQSRAFRLKNHLSKEQLQEMYIEKQMTFDEIAEIWGCDSSIIGDLLKKYSIPPRDRKNMHKTPLQDLLPKNQLYEYYIVQKLSSIEISKICNLKPAQVYNLLIRYEIPIRQKKEIAFEKYYKNDNVDIGFFEKLTPDLAYVLGLWASDGNLYNTTLSLGLVERDVIEWVSNKIGLKTKVISINSSKYNKPHVRIKFNNGYVRDIFNSYGISEKKSFNIEFPNLPDKFIPHFLRGVFDGDGSFSVKTYDRLRRKNGELRVIAILTFYSASKSFINRIKSIVESVVGGSRTINEDDRGENIVYSYHVSGVDRLIKFAYWMYPSNAFGMMKKKEKFIQLGANLSLDH